MSHYYSTINNQLFYVKSKKPQYTPNEIYEEEKRFSRYEKFKVGDKISKLIKTNLKLARVDEQGTNDIIENIRREIDGFHDANERAEYSDIEKEIDALLHSKSKIGL